MDEKVCESTSQVEMECSIRTWTAWTEEEKELFFRLLPIYQKNFRLYVSYFRNRSQVQIKSFYHNNQKRLEREAREK